VEAKFTLDVHPDADALEEYAFGRLSGADLEDSEEHLLICQRCQEDLKEVDEYILLMKRAARKLASETRGWGLAWGWARAGRVRGKWITVGMGATVAVVVLGSLALWPSRETAVTNSVQLVALRGDDMASIAHSPGGPLDLLIDVSDLPGVARFRLEVVNAAGRRHWEGTATPADGKLTVRIPKALARGTYWVRLSSSEGELLREFGLRAD